MPIALCSHRLLSAACIFVLSISTAHPYASAQAVATPATLSPAYDVITIKPNTSASGDVDIRTADDRLTATNVSLKKLLAGAYDIKEELISGITGPLESARFDIEAKISDPDPAALKKMTPEQQRLKMLPLLTERFQLKTHIETKILPAYELVILRGGPKFKPSADQTMSGNGSTSMHGSSTNYKLTAHDIPMTSLAKFIAGQMHRTVIDKTGLTGNFDLALQWSNDEKGAESDPSLFTALQEQLGLKLRSAKGPVQTLVVDQASMPSDN